MLVASDRPHRRHACPHSASSGSPWPGRTPTASGIMITMTVTIMSTQKIKIVNCLTICQEINLAGILTISQNLK